MNVIGCMDGFDEGEYMLGGTAVHNLNDSKLTKLRNNQIGFIFQKYHLIKQIQRFAECYDSSSIERLFS
jgi:putative ABC transport system ATP-binding protein